jgi:hypothetical protein
MSLKLQTATARKTPLVEDNLVNVVNTAALAMKIQPDENLQLTGTSALQECPLREQYSSSVKHWFWNLRCRFIDP